MNSLLAQMLELPDGETAFPWQCSLERRFTSSLGPFTALDIPTGLGKTSVMAAWLAALVGGAAVPRRLVYIVDRRAVVDQATAEALKLRKWVDGNSAARMQLGLEERSLPISTLRGQFVDNREWLEDPSAPAIVVGTVDMVGSRLLFEGYGVSRKMRPYHAGLLGADTLFILDEAHLVPPFEMMLHSVTADRDTFGPAAHLVGVVPDVKLISLSATGRQIDGEVIRLTDADLKHKVAGMRLAATKQLSFIESDETKTLPEMLATEAWDLTKQGTSNVRVIIFSNSPDDAEKAHGFVESFSKVNKKEGKEKQQIATELFVGGRRVHEREQAAEWLGANGFLAGSGKPSCPAFLFATSAGEVGVDMDADHMVCDLVHWERMVQRLGRVNRRGNGKAIVRVVVESPKIDKPTQKAMNTAETDRTKAEQKKVDEFAAVRETVDVLRRPLMELPGPMDCKDASPGAIRLAKIKSETDPRLAAIFDAATSKPPLRPALTRAVVDSWSMTSLEKHTGRPVVAPWLRGWIDEDPQTTVLWREFLPVREVTKEITKHDLRDATEFFENAPPQLTETLDAESFRVLDWLIKRATTFNSRASNDAEDDTARGSSIQPDTIVAMILGRASEVERMLRLRDLTFDSTDKKKDKYDKETLQRDLYGATLVVDGRLGGLTSNGLLDPKVKSDVITFDGDERFSSVLGFRVRTSDVKDFNVSEKSNDSRFQTVLRFGTKFTSDEEPTEFLIVDQWKQASSSEDGRSISNGLQTLNDHQSWAEREAERLAKRIGLPKDYAKMLRIAARLHDEGKRSLRWQRAFNAPPDGVHYAKTKGPVKFSVLDGYRHEFGSLPILQADAEFQQLAPGLRELALHLVAAHHGFARPVIRTTGCEDGPPSALEERAREVALRYAKLQRRWGPWGLAWWESLLRSADQRASSDLETQEHREVKNG